MDNFNFPLINAILNSLSFLFLCIGTIAIKLKWTVFHRLMMISALTTSAVFLVSYLIYHYQVGHVVYTGSVPKIYYTMLFTHVVLSVVMLPLIFLAVKAIYKGNNLEHKHWVKYALPIWIYVSITGVLIYWFVHL